MMYTLDEIKIIMSSLHITQAKLAEWIGVSRVTTVKILQGKSSHMRIKRLAITYVLDKYMDNQNLFFDRMNQKVVDIHELYY